jgi:hypothetical protein
MRPAVGPRAPRDEDSVMTRIRVPAALLALSMATLAVVSLVALPAAAADLPFQGATPAAGDAATPLAFAVTIDGAMPGDTIAPATIALPPTHRGPFRLRAESSGSAALAELVHARITTDDGTVLYDGPLASAVASGDSANGGAVLSVALRLDAMAGNDVQGKRIAVQWHLQVADGLD